MIDNILAISDPTVSFKATPRLRQFFKEHKKEFFCYEHVPINILNLENEDDVLLKLGDIQWLNSFLKHKREVECPEFKPITGTSLKSEIYKLLTDKKNFTKKMNIDYEQRNSNIYLHELLETSAYILPKNEILKRNPVLAARVEKLKREQEEKEYRAMTRNVNRDRRFLKEHSVGYQLNMMNRHLIAVGQFIISVAAGFAFGFLGIELLIGDLEFGLRLLLGVASALAIAVAEFYFLAKHLSDEENAESSSDLTRFG